MTSKPPSYGDLFFGLKEGPSAIFPKNADYKNHVSAWINKNVFNHHELPQVAEESVQNFSAYFQNVARKKWADTNRQIKRGRDENLDLWLDTHIPLYCLYPCNCSTCNVVAMEVDDNEPKNFTPEKIGDISRGLRNNPDIPDEAIFHAAMQLIFERGGTDARLAMRKLVESPNDLSVVRDVLNGLDKNQDIFDVEMFLHLSDLFRLSDSQTLEMAKVVRSHYGRNSIPNLEDSDA